MTEKRLRDLDVQQVREVLDYNKAQRHLRGGMATKAKFAK